MKLLPNEHKLLVSNDELFVLTNIRVIQSSKSIGFAKSSFIFLEDISSIHSVYKSSIIAIIIACIGYLFSVLIFLQAEGNTPLLFAGLGIGTLGVLLWFYTRKRIISIYPNGGKPIEFEVNGMASDQVREFIDDVQEAKASRMRELDRYGFSI